MWKCTGLLPSVPNSAHGRLLSPPPPSLMGASLAVNAMPFFGFFFSNSALASQADEDGGCSFKTNYGASTGAECTPRRMIRSRVHSRAPISHVSDQKNTPVELNTFPKEPHSIVFNVGRLILNMDQTVKPHGSQPYSRLRTWRVPSNTSGGRFISSSTYFSGFALQGSARLHRSSAHLQKCDSSSASHLQSTEEDNIWGVGGG